MTQLIVSIEDASLLGDIKKAIRLLRGVASVKVSKSAEVPNPATVKAIKDLEEGHSFVCEDFNDYLRLVSDELPD